MGSHEDAWIGARKGGAVKWMELLERGACSEVGASLAGAIERLGIPKLAAFLVKVDVIDATKRANNVDAVVAQDEFYESRYVAGDWQKLPARSSLGFVKKAD